MKINKAVIPVAGLGTRLLPITKSMPKEMLPILDKPVIHYVINEAINAGLDDILLVIGKGKRSIVDYFDRSFDLEYFLNISGKKDQIIEIEEIGDMIDLHYVQQKIPLGLGDAILHAEKHVNGEPFTVLLGDDIIINDKLAITQLLETYEKYSNSYVVGAEMIKKKDVEKYGIISGRHISKHIIDVQNMVEKPSIDQTPSTNAIIGRYILEPDIFDSLKNTKLGVNKELQLTDALINKLDDGKRIIGKLVQGKRYDIGNVVGLIKANIEMGLLDDRFSKDLVDILSNISL